jgi:hypothetical protein
MSMFAATICRTAPLASAALPKTHRRGRTATTRALSSPAGPGQQPPSRRPLSPYRAQPQPEPRPSGHDGEQTTVDPRHSCGQECRIRAPLALTPSRRPTQGPPTPEQPKWWAQILLLKPRVPLSHPRHPISHPGPMPGSFGPGTPAVDPHLRPGHRYGRPLDWQTGGEMRLVGSPSATCPARCDHSRARLDAGRLNGQGSRGVSWVDHGVALYLERPWPRSPVAADIAWTRTSSKIGNRGLGICQSNGPRAVVVFLQ